MSMLIPVKSIKNELSGHIRHELRTDIPSFHLRGADVSVDDESTLMFDVYRMENSWHVVGSGGVRVQTSCSRCLEKASMTIDLDFSVEIPDEHDGKSQDVPNYDEEMPSEGIIPEVNNNWEIDVGPRVREEIILGIPLKIICGTDCEGLCPICGTNLNDDTCDCEQEDIDPRMEKLKQLKESLGEGDLI